VGRTLAGLAGATYITATAYIADISSPGERAARFGLIGAAFGIGFVIGPALGGLAATWHVSAPFWLAAGLSALNFAVRSLYPAGIAQARKPPSVRRARPQPVRNDLRSFRMPGLAIPLICIASSSSPTWPTHALGVLGREAFGWSTLVIGLSLSAYGMLIALASGRGDAARGQPVGGNARLAIWGSCLRRSCSWASGSQMRPGWCWCCCPWRR
jgi:DHA1 family tetracycline resistance protein-like MFS transporter